MIDVQNDFMPGGALAVPHGDEVVPVVNRLARRFAQVVLTQDWHPGDHVSFAANHAGAQPFQTLPLLYGEQVLWPVHCVQDTPGAALHAGLAIPHARLVVRKGCQRQVDSYPPSGGGPCHPHRPGRLPARAGREARVLRGAGHGLLRGTGALDARAAGFEAVVVEDACRAIDLQGSLASGGRWRRPAWCAPSPMPCRSQPGPVRPIDA